MNGEHNQIVRLPVSVRAESRRGIAERFALTFPTASARALSLLQRMEPRSRLRQKALQHSFRRAVEALNRGDYEAGFCLFHDDCKFVPLGGVRTLDFEGTKGRDERIRFQRQWVEEWGEFRLEPEEVIDLGDGRRLMWVGRAVGSGRASGAAFNDECAVVLEVVDGTVRHEQVFFDHARAFEAAGLTA